MRMISGGKWAPLKLIAIVVLLHDVLLVMEGDHTANGLKYNFATKPLEGLEDAEKMAALGITLQPYDVWTFARCDDLYGQEWPGSCPGSRPAVSSL